MREVVLSGLWMNQLDLFNESIDLIKKSGSWVSTQWLTDSITAVRSLLKRDSPLLTQSDCLDSKVKKYSHKMKNFIFFETLNPQSPFIVTAWKKKTSSTIFKMCLFTFHRRKKVIWFWNDMRMNTWWWYFHFWVNYCFTKEITTQAYSTDFVSRSHNA